MKQYSSWRLSLLGLLLLPMSVACGKGDSGTSPSSASSAPTVVGCNAVSYRGVTWSNLGCAPGIASFSLSISQGGQSACFNVTCSAGCVASARTC